MIPWNVDPIIFTIPIPGLGEFSLRYYSVLFALGFLFGFFFMKKRYEEVGLSQEKLDKLLIYMMVATVVGARLGHIFFYEPSVVFNDPIQIFRVWEGGLASHGGAIGILLALFVYTRVNAEIDMLWLLDRIVIPIALAGAFIRLGNLFNSEIIGNPTDVPWAVVFERIDTLPRHPTQVYESLAYFFSFFALRWMYGNADLRASRGFIFGMFLVLIFSFRFVIEFFKEHQASFEQSLPLGMGQLLSIPFVLLGVYFISTAGNRKGKMGMPSA